MQPAEKTETPAEETKQEVNRPLRKIAASRFNLAEFATQYWRATIPATDTPDDILKPEYWAHVAGQIKPLAVIEAVWEDASIYARLVVVDVDMSPVPNWIKVSGVEIVKLSNAAGPINDRQYECRYVNHHSKWCVFRLSDNARLKDKLENEDAARDWLKEYIKAMRK